MNAILETDWKKLDWQKDLLSMKNLHFWLHLTEILVILNARWLIILNKFDEDLTKIVDFPNAPPPPGTEAGWRPAIAGTAAFSKKSHAFLMNAQSEC